MPRYPVLQPDGNLAVWSTIVDAFVAIDCSPDEATSVLLQWFDNESRSNLRAIVDRCAKGEIVYDWWWDWPKCVAWAAFLHGESDETVRRAMECTPDAMTRRYIEQYVATCKAESAKDDADSRAVTWVPVGERLPDTMLRVLAAYVKDGATTTIRALHIAAHEAICWGYDFDEAVYDAEEDKYYYPEGWYEAMEDGEFAFIGPVEGMVTHWAKLPPLPSRE